MGENRGWWSAAAGIVVLLFGSGALTYWLAARLPQSGLPIWPACVFGAIAFVGLYCVFATLLGWRPWDSEPETPRLQQAGTVAQPSPAAAPTSATPTEYAPKPRPTYSAAEERRIRALAADARALADDIYKFHRRMHRRLSSVTNATEDAFQRQRFQENFRKQGLQQRSEPLFEAGREWGFFQPSEDESTFAIGGTSGVGFTAAKLKLRLERLDAFADHLDDDLRAHGVPVPKNSC